MANRPFEFFLLRYMPNVVKGEFVNIAVVLIESTANEPGLEPFADVRFARDWQRVRCLDPQADVEMLLALEREIRAELATTHGRDDLLHRFEDSFSNVIQLSPIKGCLTEDPEREIKVMASMYLEAAKIGEKRETPGRQRILVNMREAFEKAGVLALLAPVATEPYTKKGDPFQFDFGYSINGGIKLFHAVSLKRSVDPAILLGLMYSLVVPAMARIANAAPVLTAVIDNDFDHDKKSVQFALDMMKDDGIQIRPVAEMPMIAEAARHELSA
jgi:hypothetical protein